MRAKPVTTLVRVALLFMAVAALGIPVASADEAECIQACADEWFVERQACVDTLNSTLAEVDAQVEACINGCSPADLLCQGKCINQGNIRRYNANQDYRRCESIANTVAWNCYRACQVSPSQP